MSNARWILAFVLPTLAACGSSSVPTDGSSGSDVGGNTDATRADTAAPTDANRVDAPAQGPDARAGEDVVTGTDAASPADVTSVPDVVLTPIGPTGGSVDLLRFAVFGDIRPSLPIPGSSYPSETFAQVMSGIQDVGAQFAVATGDYMNSNFCESCVNSQLDLLQAAEGWYHGPVFHSMGNHECNTVTSVNCPNENESPNIRVARSRLLAPYAHSYYDWFIHTRLGDAHFIATSPNTWNDAQLTWLNAALAMPATYTFLIAHEPPSDPGPGTTAIEGAIRTRVGGVTMRLYGHVHHYEHPEANVLITGNAGAPLSGSGSYYGFTVVQQRADGNLEFTAYEIGHPPMVQDTFVMQPDGTLGH